MQRWNDAGANVRRTFQPKPDEHDTTKQTSSKMTGRLAHPTVRPLALPITCQHNDTKTLNIVIDINHSTGL